MKRFYVTFLALLLSSVAYPKDLCEMCMPVEDCKVFGILNGEQQILWRKKIACSPDNQFHEDSRKFNTSHILCCLHFNWKEEKNIPSWKTVQNTHEIQNQNTESKLNYDHNFDKQTNNFNPQSTEQSIIRMPRQNNRNAHWNDRPGRNQWSYENVNQNRHNQQERTNNPNYSGNSGWNNWQRNNNARNWNTPRPNYPNKDNSSRRQCPVTSLTPDPSRGCCGQEASDDDRITGGEATELYEYPWIVRLLTYYNHGTTWDSLSCGGSLINSRFVLSAAHCVYSVNGTWIRTEVTLAEYDKRTFPRDCKGSRCIENKVMYASRIVMHPEFVFDVLLNDISLIKLDGIAKYDDYIRPICLPTINIDDPKFDTLQFEVAGWGQNGQVPSNIKRSTFLRLVNREVCRKSYSWLTEKHLCAAGSKEEDTCKGDSGGPLMMLYRGRYHLMGIVSGKRVDTMCGNVNIPSLYTNVYYFLNWIKDTMRKL